MSGQAREQDPIVRVALTVMFVNLVGTSAMAVVLSTILFVRSMTAEEVVSKETFWALFVVGTFNAFAAVYIRHRAKARDAAAESS